MVSKHSPDIDQQNIYYGGVINDIGTILLASRNGLIKYDGKRSTMINTGGSVFDVGLNQQEDIFLATSIGLLKMKKTVGLVGEISSLMPLNDQTPINQVLTFGKGVYGVSDNVIYYRSYTSDSTVQIQDGHAGRFYNIYELDNRIYVNSDNKGTLEITDGKTSSDVPTFLESETVIFSSKNPETNQYLLAVSSGKLFISKDGKANLLKVDDPMLNDGEPMIGLWYSKEEVVVGTTTEGVFFIDVNTGKITSKLDYNTGLEDNEVLSLILDKNKGVSVIGNYALNHISPNIPIKSFQYYEGLSGDINSTAYNQDKLYVGTNLGLFSLQRITDYEEVVSYQKRRKKITKPKPVEETKKRKRLFNFKKKKKITEEKVVEEQEIVVTQKKVTKKATATYHVYKEVDPRISQVSQMLSIENRLIVGGLSGVFEIIEGEAKKISESDARYLYLSEDNNKLFVSTADQQVLVFLRRNNEWVYRDVFTDFRAKIDHIREFKGDYWLCSPDRVYKMKILDNELDEVEEFLLKNPYYSTVYSTLISGELSFISSSGSFMIKGDSITTINNSGRIDNVIIDNKNNIWKFSNNDWEKLNGDKNELPVFKAFKKLKSITYIDNTATFWIVTEENEILQFKEDVMIPTSYYTPYLEKVTSKSKTPDKLVVVQDESQLSFEIAYADLSNIFDTKYRYQLKGMDDVWSKWTKESTINFAFLPAGNYTLSIEAQNAFGKAYEISPTSFKVLEPYWKRPLFYVFEIGVVLCLFLLSITLKSWGYKYRLVSRLLAFLTLVIIMEYIEAVMESYFVLESSPVFSFSLQVIMAMIILPFEGVLKKYVFKEKMDLTTYFELKGEQKIKKRED